MRNSTSLVALGIMILSSCSSVGTRVAVIDRSDDLSSAPEWVKIGTTNSERDGTASFLGYVEVSGDALKSAALNMADEKALSEPMRAMVSEFLDQNQVGEDLASSTGSRIISATRGFRPNMPSLRITKRYWEVVETQGANGSYSSTKLRVYSQAQIPAGDLAKAVQSYLAHLNKNTEIKKILAEVGAKQRQKILAADAQE